MKVKILIVVVLMIGSWALGQVKEVTDCSKIKDYEERIICLEEQLKAEHRKNQNLKIDDSSYHKGQPNEVVIDFSKSLNVISVPNKIRKGDFYQIVVQNFNPNRYSVQINRSDSTNSKALKLPTFADFSLDALSSLTSSFTNEATVRLFEYINIRPGNRVEAIKLELSEVITTLSLASEEYVAYLETAENTEEKVKKIIKLEKENLKNLEKIFLSLNDDFDNLKFQVYNYRLEALKEIPDINAPFRFEDFLKNVEQLRSNNQEFSKQANKLKSIYAKLISNKEITDFLKKNEDYKNKINNISTLYETVRKKNEEFKGIISADNSEKLLKSVLFFVRDNYYKSLPIQFRGDLEELSISFVPKDSTSGLQTETLSPLVFPVVKNDYWSVGTSFYYSNLSNERFSTLSQPKTDSTSVYTFKREEDNRREAGMAVMLRFGKKIDKSENFGIHGSFGPGVSIEKNVRPRILFGIGASYGKKHNIVVDWGGILGYVDRKSTIVEEGAEFFEKPEATVTKIMIGNYFSIGYMFKL